MTGERSFDVVIVGSGHGGAQTAIALRQKGYSGSVAIVTEERDPPYERPPLSKEYFSSKKPFERILIRPAKFWVDRNIELLFGCRIVEVDASSHALKAETDDVITFGKLVWATGGQARRLSCPGRALKGVHSVRTRSDVDKILSELAHTANIVIVGGGYIGLEAAAALTQLGKQTTLLEARERLLARVAGPTISRFYEDEHRKRGVDIRLNASLERIEEDGDGRVAGVQLSDGTLLPCTMVIVGIGIDPATRPLVQAGASSGDASGGVSVDEHCRTSLADIYAVGDCAVHANTFASGSLIRLESVQNANDMAVTVAKDIVGEPSPYRAIPWFWSQQYDLRLQTVGILSGFDQEIVQGDVGARSFSVAYVKDGRSIAFDCVNSTKDFVAGRAALQTEIGSRRG